MTFIIDASNGVLLVWGFLVDTPCCLAFTSQVLSHISRERALLVILMAILL
jgi:hypothetical protein